MNVLMVVMLLGGEQSPACAQASTLGADTLALCQGEEALRASHFDEAVTRARRAASQATTGETRERATDLLAQLYDEQHLNQSVLEEGALRDLIRLKPRDLGPVARLSKLQERLGFVDAAEDTLLTARHQQPEDAEPYRLLAQFYARRVTAMVKPATAQSLVVPTAPPQPDKDGVYPVGGVIKAPTRLDAVQYPTEAKTAGIQGVVIVEAVIDEAGNVSDTKVLRSIPLLDDPTVSAIRNWRFTPTMLDGQPVKVRLMLSQNFTLK